jgi:hypothetical protein
MLETLNPNERNLWAKRRGIDEIPKGDGGGCHCETRDALGWTGIIGQGLTTRRVLFTLRERSEESFSWWSKEGVSKEEEIRLIK